MPERQRMTTRLKTLFQRPALFVLAGGINPIGAKMRKRWAMTPSTCPGAIPRRTNWAGPTPGPVCATWWTTPGKIVLTVQIPPCCTDRWLAARRDGISGTPFLTADHHRAIQSEPRSPASHPEAAAQSDELGCLLTLPAPARKPDRLVHGNSDCGVEGRAPRHARRSAALLVVGDHHGADAASGFSAWRYARPKG